MKLNKTLMMAVLIAGTVFAANAVLAQDAASTNAPAANQRAPRGRLTAEVIATRLALTDDQKTKVTPIIDDMLKKQAEVRKDDSLSREEKQAKAKEIRDDATTKLKDILTPDQLEKWQKIGVRRTPAATAPAAPAGTNDSK